MWPAKCHSISSKNKLSKSVYFIITIDVLVFHLSQVFVLKLRRFLDDVLLLLLLLLLEE